MQLSGTVDGIHHLGSQDVAVDVGGQLLAGLDAVDEGVDLVLEQCCG